jgi:hypothetical protein
MEISLELPKNIKVPSTLWSSWLCLLHSFHPPPTVCVWGPQGLVLRPPFFCLIPSPAESPLALAADSLPWHLSLHFQLSVPRFLQGRLWIITWETEMQTLGSGPSQASWNQSLYVNQIPKCFVCAWQYEMSTLPPLLSHQPSLQSDWTAVASDCKLWLCFLIHWFTQTLPTRGRCWRYSEQKYVLIPTLMELGI